MASRQYELTFILPPSLAEDEINAVQENVSTWLSNNQGEITRTSHWGRQRLAYAVNNYKEGYYIFIEFTGEPSGLKELDRRIRLDTTILRHLIVRVDE